MYDTTDIAADEIYHHLADNHLLPQEQKGCRRKSRETKNQLLIDKAVMKICRRRKVNEGYQLGKKQNKNIDYLLLMGDLKLYGNNEKKVERLRDTVRIFPKDIIMELHINRCAYKAMKIEKLNCFGGREISYQN